MAPCNTSTNYFLSIWAQTNTGRFRIVTEAQQATKSPSLWSFVWDMKPKNFSFPNAPSVRSISQPSKEKSERSHCLLARAPPPGPKFIFINLSFPYAGYYLQLVCSVGLHPISLDSFCLINLLKRCFNWNNELLALYFSIFLCCWFS
jgi:hypothetical protein